MQDRLLRRSPLLPNESLHSYVERLAALNHYQSSGTILNLIQKKNRSIESIVLLSDAEEFERLARLAGPSSRDIYDTTYDRFAPILSWHANKSVAHELSNNEKCQLAPNSNAYEKGRFLPPSASQFCPRCLAERPYHRVEWHLVCVAACATHRCLLSSACGKCGKPVNIRSIVQNRCRVCGSALSDTKTAKLQGDPQGFFSQQVLQNWLGVLPLPEKPWPFSIPDQPPSSLIRFVDGLSYCLRDCDKAWFLSKVHQAEGMDNEEVWRNLASDVTPNRPSVYISFATAMKLLDDWPNAFQKFLLKYPSRHATYRATGALHKDFGSLYSYFLEGEWLSEEFRFVQDAFDDFLVERYGFSSSLAKIDRYGRKGGLSSKYPAMTCTSVARRLGVSKRMVIQLVQSGHLREYCPFLPSKSHYIRYVWQDSVMGLDRRWGGTMCLKEAASMMGVNKDVVLDLIARNSILPVTELSLTGREPWVLQKNSIRQFMDAVRKSAEPYRRGQLDCRTLAEASRQLSSMGIKAADLLGWLLSGKMNAYYSPMGIFRFTSLLFSTLQIHSLPVVLMKENGWVGRETIARAMGVKETVVARWVSNGLLQPVATKNHVQYFSRDEVSRFVYEHVFTEDAARILDVGVLTVQKWARGGKLSPIAGRNVDGGHRYLFQRGDIEKLNLERH